MDLAGSQKATGEPEGKHSDTEHRHEPVKGLGFRGQGLECQHPDTEYRHAPVKNSQKRVSEDLYLERDSSRYV